MVGHFLVGRASLALKKSGERCSPYYRSATHCGCITLVMTEHTKQQQYALGSTPAEHERLAWQAERFDPFTERFFREAGISAGQRVLDLGSGAGHVAMLVARIVGPSGGVFGIERDANSIARARARVAEAGLCNVTFTQSDVHDFSARDQFDAAVGRFILMFLPDPARIVRALAGVIRPGGVIAFQEVSWAAFLRRSANTPLCAACARLIHETFQRTGSNTEMGPALDAVYREAGLAAPTMTSAMLLGNAPDLTRWLVDLLNVLKPQIQQLGLPFDDVGPMETLSDRLFAELAASKDVIGGPDIVGGWSRTDSTKV
jgi:ubiquinone/menaquinone biosynthesis C-methylase UbiE